MDFRCKLKIHGNKQTKKKNLVYLLHFQHHIFSAAVINHISSNFLLTHFSASHVFTVTSLRSIEQVSVSFQVINSCTEVWQGVCQQLGWRIDESIQDASHWKGVYLKAKLRMMQLKDQEAFVTSSLIGHSARVYALYYKDGLLCTGAPYL